MLLNNVSRYANFPIAVMDLKGVGLTSINSVYTYIKSASAISQNYYPERLGKLCKLPSSGR